MTQNEKSKIRAKVIKWVTRLFLILVAIIMLYPLAWNVVSSFKTSTEFLTDPFAWPQGLAWDNYVRAYEKSNLAANIGNSIYVVLETLVIIVICVVPCSYCLVRYKFPGAKLILNIYMAAIFIQATYIMIPLFLQMNKLNLLNSLTALGVLYATMQFPFAIFLLTGRNSFLLAPSVLIMTATGFSAFLQKMRGTKNGTTLIGQQMILWPFCSSSPICAL